MGIFGAIVQTLVRSMLDAWHDFLARCGVRAELVGDHALWAAALFMEKALQQPLGGFGVAANLNDFIEDVTGS